MARRDTARTMLAASALTVLGAIPPFLLGAQAVLIQRELQFGAAGLGVAVGICFGSAALTMILGGGLLRRLGMRGSMALAGALVAGGGFGVAFLAHSWSTLVLAMVVAGGANAACQATSNAAVATTLPAHRRGLGFGIKQSAIPAAIMLGGLAVPTMSVLLGWRSTFLVTGCFGVLVLLLALLRPSGHGRRAGGRRVRRRAGGRGPGGSAPRGAPANPTVPLVPADRAPVVPLVLCGIAIVLASAGANFTGAYLASWAHRVGLSVEQAGLLVALGSGSSILVRILLGHQADRRFGGNLPVVAAQMLMGAVCLALLGLVPQVWAVVVFGALAFAAGWSWPGLFLYAVARVGRDAPTQATSVVQAGAFTGAALGPVLIGLLVEVAGFRTGWYVAATAFALAALFLWLAIGGFRRDLRRRPPAQPLGYGGGRKQPRWVTGEPG